MEFARACGRVNFYDDRQEKERQLLKEFMQTGDEFEMTFVFIITCI
jgi:hypothetical protein